MYVWADLGAGDDVLSAGRHTLDVDADSGDDVVRAVEARFIYGGAGNDTLAAAHGPVHAPRPEATAYEP
jgi:hypothetical protein